MKLKRLMMIGLLVTSVVTLSAIQATAGQGSGFGGLPVSYWWGNPGLTTEFLVDHIKNPDIHPVVVAVGLQLEEGIFECVNRGGQSPTGQGIPHSLLETIIGQSIPVEEADLIRPGWALADVVFYQADLENEAWPALEIGCQNFNWDPEPGTLILISQDALYTAWNLDKYGNWYLSDWVALDCKILEYDPNAENNPYDCYECVPEVEPTSDDFSAIMSGKYVWYGCNAATDRRLEE